MNAIAFNELAKAHLDRFTNKQMRAAFLVGLSLGARELNDEERIRVARNLKALYGVDVPDNKPAQKSKTAREERPTSIGDISPEMLARIANLKMKGSE